MRGLLERIELDADFPVGTLQEESAMRKALEKRGITAEKGCIGKSSKDGKWYGWSHRAICGFGMGDRIFDQNYGDDQTPFVKHGKRPIKNNDDAKEAAKRFASYVS